MRAHFREPADYASANESDSSAEGSTVTPTTGPVRFKDLVDLTSEGFCRVVMTRPHRICGCLKGQCPRRGHNDKAASGDISLRGAPGFYVSHPGRKGSILDGLGNEACLNKEDAEELRKRDEEEDEIRRRALADSTEVDLEGQGTPPSLPTETFGTPGEGPPDPLPDQGTVPPVPSPQGTQDTQDLPPVRDPNTHDGGLFLGLEENRTGARTVETSLDDSRVRIELGWTYKRRFSTRRDADRWVQQATLRPTSQPGGSNLRSPHGRPSPNTNGTRLPRPSDPATIPPPPDGITIYGMEDPNTRSRSLAWSREEYDILSDTGFVVRKLFRDASAAQSWDAGVDLQGIGHAQRLVGPDKSTHALEVFGQNINDFEAVDKLLLPPGTPVADSTEYFDAATDVMALPGGYRGNDGDDGGDHGLAEAMLAMASGTREASKHVRYGAGNNNGLRKLKKKDDLPDFIESVNEAADAAATAMEGQVRKKMYRSGFSGLDITDYLQTGGLFRIVADTLKFYQSFLTTLTGHVNSMGPGEAWVNSVGHLVWKTHLDKLTLIRQTSASYRDLVLRNYTYMRDQHRTSFWNDKLSKKSALTSRRELAALTAGRGRGQRGASPSGPQVCSTCHKKHQGSCPLGPLSQSLRNKLLDGLSPRQIGKALKAFREGLRDSPDTPHPELVSLARAAATA